MSTYLVDKKGIAKERIAEGEMSVMLSKKDDELLKLGLKVEVE